jgi:hypothetical protein
VKGTIIPTDDNKILPGMKQQREARGINDADFGEVQSTIVDG